MKDEEGKERYLGIFINEDGKIKYKLLRSFSSVINGPLLCAPVQTSTGLGT